MSDDIYKQIETHAALVQSLRRQLEEAEAAFRGLVDRTGGKPLPRIMPKRQSTPARAITKKKVARRRGSRMSEETKSLLKYLKGNTKPETAAMVKIIADQDNEASRKNLHSRMYTLRKKHYIRERAGGGYEVLVEVS
jgi:hypothetical protein